MIILPNSDPSGGRPFLNLFFYLRKTSRTLVKTARKLGIQGWGSFKSALVQSMYLSCLQRTREPKRSLTCVMSAHKNDCSAICPSKRIRLLRNSPTVVFSPSTVAGYGERSRVFSKFEMTPEILLDTKKQLNLNVDINFLDYLLSDEVREELRENPEKAISVTFFRESDRYWQEVSDNRHLVDSAKQQSGNTYQIRTWGDADDLVYNVHIKSLSAGSTYLMVVNIAKHVPKNHMNIVKFRLVCFLQQALCKKSQRSLHPGVNSRPPCPKSWELTLKEFCLQPTCSSK